MIQMLTSVIGQRGVDAMAFLLAFALTALTDSIFRDKLPHDHGRAFAVNGELSKGKARGSRIDLCAVHRAGVAGVSALHHRVCGV